MITVKYDGTIEIAVGKNRWSKSWKNQRWLWSDFIKKISEITKTYESHNDYLSMPKSKQDEIKDVGGFVGGTLSGGQRKKENVMSRSMIVLDIDAGSVGLWESFTLLYGNAAAVYSTHKHSTGKPRLRLCIPLLREVSREEYEPAARMVAGDLGIDCFDDTTYEASRLMYWPSTPRDGDYYFNYHDGKWLDPDTVLSRYKNWRDASSWPQSDRVKAIIKREIKKQGDPLEKPGLIGAFCRTYSIHEAIGRFLEDEYEACGNGRYTYRNGSTTAGLVIYDDKFAYSHHGTDPVSGKLCNAFDIVRLHKYGLLDEDAAENTPNNRLPSFKAMTDFISNDTDVRRLLGKERLLEANADFEDMEKEEGSLDWLGLLDTDKRGQCKPTIDNIVVILNNDPKLKGRLALNLFEQREITKGDLPWRVITKETRYLTDKDDAGLRHYIEKNYHISGIQKTKDAMDLVLLKNAFHPVREYLDSLVWDGVKRLDTYFIDFLGVRDTRYARAVTRKTLAAAVARIYIPGTKFDYVLTLVGPQGTFKSTSIKKLGLFWYSDSFITVVGKEAYEQIQGVWLMEISELAGLKKAELEQIKHFISKTDDRFRVAYGRRIENFPRQCVFFGTVNDKDFLRDPTGNRRFWPLDVRETTPVKNIFVDLTEYEIGQIWAEAKEAFKNGEELFLSADLEQRALEAQEAHSHTDDRTGVVSAYLETLLPENWKELDLYDRRNYLTEKENIRAKGVKRRDRVCVAEIWCECFGGLQKDMASVNTKDLHNVMKKIEGWEPSGSSQRFPIYGTQRCYVRKK